MSNAAESSYWGEQIHVLVLAASGFQARAAGRNDEALKLLRAAADLEDSTEKHVAMENRLYPMREMLGDLLLETGQPAPALQAYEASLHAAPNRLRGFYGAARAARATGDSVELLTKAGVQDDGNPDLENLLGYAYRHLGQLDEAF